MISETSSIATCEISAAGTKGNNNVTCAGTPAEGLCVHVRSRHRSTIAGTRGTGTMIAVRRLRTSTACPPGDYTRRQRCAGGPCIVSLPKKVAVHCQALVFTVTVTVPGWPSGPCTAWLQPLSSPWYQTASFGLPETTEKSLQPASA